MTSAAMLLLKTTAKYLDMRAAGQRLCASWGAAATMPHAKGSEVTRETHDPSLYPRLPRLSLCWEWGR